MSPRLLSSRELSSHTFPTPAYLVEPMIPQGGLAILHGKPGVGKTQLVLSLAHAINTGTPWLNRWPTRRGVVVVIQADMTGQIQQDRILKVIQHADISDTYWLVEEDGATPQINVQTMAILQRELVAAIQALDPLLIVWDTLRKIHYLPENASESAITVFRSVREISQSATHLFIHHNRKVPRDPDAVEADDEDFMGNQQWKGAVDATFSLRELADCVPRRLVLTFHKARTAADTERKPPALLELDMSTVMLLPLK